MCANGGTRPSFGLIVPVVGTLAGAPLDRWFGTDIVRMASDRPDARNICGLFAAPMLPPFVVAGAVAGAAITVAALTAVLTRRA
jgi:hypothetical protein